MRASLAVALILPVALAGCPALLSDWTIGGSGAADAGAGGTTTTECTGRNDCANGEICLFGACSHTCRKDADCPAGQRCLSTDQGAACVTPNQATCTTTACPAGSSCRQDQCRSDCVDSSGCGTDQICSPVSGCVGTDVKHDPAAMDGGGSSGGAGGAAGADGTGGLTNSGGTGSTGGTTGVGGATSAGGLGGTIGSGGLAGTGGVGALGAVGALGQPCSLNGSYACAGHAQKGQLVCASGSWQGNGTCSGSNNCDTTPGSNAGSCQPIVAECIGKNPGDALCQGMNRVSCGPDLVTTTVDTCATGTQTCVSGVCVTCNAGTANCDGNASDCETNLNSTATCGTTCANKVACSTTCRGGACVVPPSCNGLAATCGATGDASCCSSSLVPGGTYNRSNDPGYPATVSDFRLDTYEITVGRFRKFVAAYSQTMTAAGAGKNPNNATDPGWDIAWNTSLPASAAALQTAVQCDASQQQQTWTTSAGAKENRPMNCIDWYESFAFCIWDGGRLPTEAEWNYAAAGGSEQRAYPWGSAAPDCSYANNYAGAFCSATYTKSVGSDPKGNGKWGHADLAGNVSEWNLDWYASPYPQVSCANCADTTVASRRVARGGDYTLSSLLSSNRNSFDPKGRGTYIGARCARSAP